MQWFELACQYKDGCSRQNCHHCASCRFVLRSNDSDFKDVKKDNDLENHFAGGLI